MPADLHLHTKASDGTDSIKTRIKDAKQKNLDIIAITDHDTLNNNLKDRKTMRKQVKIITGIELKSFIQKTRIEVLGYFIDPSNKHINRLLNKQKEKRVERMKKFTENLKQH